MIARCRLRPWLLGTVLLPTIALAQRVDDNAVTAANDAFGTTVGTQTIGLYDPEDVRGFSPRDAGNLRIEGLYFDQQTYAANSCLVPEQSIKVGLTAQSFDFPAPTGIADYSLSIPGAGNLTSVVAAVGPFEASSLELDGRYGSSTQPFGVSLCFHRSLNSDFDFAKHTQSNDTGLIVRSGLPKNMELIAFAGTSRGNEHQALPFVYTDGDLGIPTFRQMRLPSQEWTRWTWRDGTAGAILRSSATEHWSFAAGVFRSTVDNPAYNYNDLLLDLAPDRTADHQMDVLPALTAHSTSGEIRMSYQTSGATHAERWALTVRGRSVSRTFGGDSITDYGRVSIDDFSVLPPPVVNFTAGSVDRVRQLGLGISFDELWPGRGSVGVGLQKVSYQRTIEAPDVPSTTDRSNPLLPTFRFTYSPASSFLLYGSYARGLEDSALAPANAVNRGESPPATTTWQVDAGIRYEPQPGAQFLLGAFEVNKAYFNLNDADVYMQLGQIRHRGLEASATLNNGQGLVAVLGGVWLQASVLGNASDPTLSGTPLGSVPLVLNADLDYAPPSWRPWALSFGWQGVSERPETNSGNMQLPAYSQFSLTLRYEFQIFGHPGVMRLDADDIGDSSAMMIDTSGHVLSERGRSYTLTLTADF